MELPHLGKNCSEDFCNRLGKFISYNTRCIIYILIVLLLQTFYHLNVIRAKKYIGRY